MTLNKNFFSSNLIEFSKKASILEKEEEFFLINDWRDNKNPKSFTFFGLKLLEHNSLINFSGIFFLFKQTR